MNSASRTRTTIQVSLRATVWQGPSGREIIKENRGDFIRTGGRTIIMTIAGWTTEMAADWYLKKQENDTQTYLKQHWRTFPGLPVSGGWASWSGAGASLTAQSWSSLSAPEEWGRRQFADPQYRLEGKVGWDICQETFQHSETGHFHLFSCRASGGSPTIWGRE